MDKAEISTTSATSSTTMDNNNNNNNRDEEAGAPTPAAITNKIRPSLQRHTTFDTVPGLKLTCYRIAADGSLLEAELEDAIAARQSKPTGEKPLVSYWVDADVRDGHDAKELHDIVQSIRLTPFLKRHLAKPNQIQTPQVLSLNSSVFLVMRVLPPAEDTSNDMRYVAALSVKGLLLTVTSCPKEAKSARASHYLNQSTRKSVEERELPEASTSGALAMWLLFHVQRVSSINQKLRRDCFTLDEEMDEGIQTIDMEDIVDLKNKVNLSVAVSEEQFECMENLKEGENITSGLDFVNLKGSMGLVVATAGANERMSGRLEKKVADLRTTYDSHQQAQINHRLEILTILSAIFLPLTLMAGLWGMNFTNMPELQRENGYYWALSAMATVAGVLLLVFYRYGWFGKR